MRTEDYRSWLVERGAVFDDSTIPVVLHFGDATQEYDTALRGASLACHAERETATAEGTEVVPIIQGLVTSDVYQLAEEGSGQLGTMVNITGRLISDLRILHVADTLVLDFEAGATDNGALAHLRGGIMTEDAKIRDRTASTGRLGLYGPDASKLLGEVFSLVHNPQNLARWHGTWGKEESSDVIVQRVHRADTDAFYLYLDRELMHSYAQRLVEAGAGLIGAEALERLRIEAKVPRFGVELDEKIIPLEALLHEAISFEKGCYLGQEIIARLDTLGVPAKILRKIDFEVGAPAEGTKLFVEGKAVGEVRSAAGKVALAYIKRNFNDIGTELQTEEGLNGQIVS